MTPQTRLFVCLSSLLLISSLLLTSTLTSQIRGVKDIRPGTGSSSPRELLRWKKHVYFTADDGRVGRELWRTDGNRSGTQLVKDIMPGATGSDPNNLMVAGGKLFFIAGTKTYGRELYVTDGTAAGTRMVDDIRVGANGGALAVLGAFGGRLYFIAKPFRNGKEGIWVSNGSKNGTDWFDPKRRLSTSVDKFIVFGDRILLWTEVDNREGTELCISDGTGPGTTLLKDIEKGPASSFVTGFKVIGSKCYFSAQNRAYGYEPWVTDGTTKGTRVIDVVPGTQSSFAGGFTGTEDSVFFRAQVAKTGQELFWTDGQLIKIHDINPGRNPSSPGSLTSIGAGEVLFAAKASLGRELYRASKAKFVLVKDIHRFSSSSFPASLTNVNSRHVLFSASDGKAGDELWRTDGTTQGTGMLQDLCLGSCDSDPGWLTRLGCRMLFAATTPAVGRELFIIDIGATTQVVGRGCAPGVRTPALSCTDPTLSSMVTLSITDAPTDRHIRITALTAIGLPSSVPLVLDGCSIYVNPFLPYVMLSHRITSSRLQYKLGPVPNNSSLICSSVILQALFTGLPKLETTNGLNLYFGK